MKIVYASLTGNVQRFIGKLKSYLPNHEYIKINSESEMEEDYVLITYTTGFGQIPKEVSTFIEINKNIKAVIGSGNRNWGNMFCGGAVKISEQCGVPILHTFELSGLDSDVKIVANKIVELERMNNIA